MTDPAGMDEIDIRYTQLDQLDALIAQTETVLAKMKAMRGMVRARRDSLLDAAFVAAMEPTADDIQQIDEWRLADPHELPLRRVDDES